LVPGGYAALFRGQGRAGRAPAESA